MWIFSALACLVHFIRNELCDRTCDIENTRLSAVQLYLLLDTVIAAI